MVFGVLVRGRLFACLVEVVGGKIESGLWCVVEGLCNVICANLGPEVQSVEVSVELLDIYESF